MARTARGCNYSLVSACTKAIERSLRCVPVEDDIVEHWWKINIRMRCETDTDSLLMGFSYETAINTAPLLGG